MQSRSGILFHFHSTSKGTYKRGVELYRALDTLRTPLLIFKPVAWSHRTEDAVHASELRYLRYVVQHGVRHEYVQLMMGNITAAIGANDFMRH